jgi:hypothetical protein
VSPGGLYAYSLTATNPWQELNPADGATLAAGTLTGSQTGPYVAFGGYMTGVAAGVCISRMRSRRANW